jgi:hypothetical protein
LVGWVLKRAAEGVGQQPQRLAGVDEQHALGRTEEILCATTNIGRPRHLGVKHRYGRELWEEISFLMNRHPHKYLRRPQFSGIGSEPNCTM